MEGKTKRKNSKTKQKSPEDGNTGKSHPVFAYDTSIYYMQVLKLNGKCGQHIGNVT